ncbi:capsid and scaffold protein [Erwinia phage FBB1]|nr:capsid and scaffold protein [Erwinia phage FBB1]
MFKIRIDGPDYELIGSDFEYNIIVESIPDEFQGQNYSLSYTWYKNNKEISLYKNKETLKLYDAEGPASGSYRVDVAISFNDQVQSASSESIFLEMGTEPRQIIIDVDNINDMSVTLGDDIEIIPSISTNVKYPIISAQWKKNNNLYSSDASIKIENITPDNEGEYQLDIKVSAKGAYIPAEYSKIIGIYIQREIICKPRYIHDLRPARNKGFIQVGWWVIDEINEANKLGINWSLNPHDSRFKYPCDLSCLAEGFSKWEDLCVQESRNGYILERVDLIK